MNEEVICESCKRWPADMEVEDMNGRLRLVCAVCGCNTVIDNIQHKLKLEYRPQSYVCSNSFKVIKK